MNPPWSNPKEYLMQIIEELALPMIPADVQAHLANLTDDEVRDLLPSFEYVLSYQKTLAEEEEHASPERYSLIEATYDKEVRELREHFINRLESTREALDAKAESIDTSEDSEMNELLEEEKEELEFLSDTYNNLQNATNRAS